MRVVFDTNTIISALLFSNSRLAWLRAHWNQKQSVPIVSQDTVKELLRVLAYPKFQLTSEEQNELLSEFLPYSESIIINSQKKSIAPRCRDIYDQKFLILSEQASVNYLVTGDADLLTLNNESAFSIITPAEFKHLFSGC